MRRTPTVSSVASNDRGPTRRAADGASLAQPARVQDAHHPQQEPPGPRRVTVEQDIGRFDQPDVGATGGDDVLSNLICVQSCARVVDLRPGRIFPWKYLCRVVLLTGWD
jgi:hypothetical protein